MAIHTIYSICSSCNGNGTRPMMTGDDRLGVEDCPRCATTGKLEVGILDLSDIEDKIDDVMNKCNDIKEVVDEL